MRIAGYIKHPSLKITIFEMENRFALKLENAHYEQTYKLRKSSTLQSAGDVRKFATGAFIQGVERLLEQMHRLQIDAINQLLPQQSDFEFDEII